MFFFPPASCVCATDYKYMPIRWWKTGQAALDSEGKAAGGIRAGTPGKNQLHFPGLPEPDKGPKTAAGKCTPMSRRKSAIIKLASLARPGTAADKPTMSTAGPQGRRFSYQAREGLSPALCRRQSAQFLLFEGARPTVGLSLYRPGTR